MNYFLIDYENTGENGLKGIIDLGEDSCVVIFYSENADKLSFDMHQTLCRCKTAIDYRKINTGKKNALDFQLSTYLGYLIAKCEEDQFYIVSKDNGYRVVLDFWKDKKVKQVDSIGRVTAKPLMIETAKPFEKTAAATAVQKEKASEPEAVLAPEAVSEPEAASEPEAVLAPEAALEPETVLAPEAAPTSETESVSVPEGEAEADTLVEPEVAVEPEVTAQPEAAAQTETAVQPEAAAQPEQGAKRTRRGRKKKSNQKENAPADELQPTKELMKQVAQVIEEKEIQEIISRFIVKYKTKQGVNNAIVKLYGTERAGEIYKKIKPLLKDKKGK